MRDSVYYACPDVRCCTCVFDAACKYNILELKWEYRL